MKKVLLISAICATLMLASLSCKTSDGQGGLQTIEQMAETDFNQWKLYIQLGVKIGANRLLQEEVVSREELATAATAIEAVRDQAIIPGATSFIIPALEKAGLTNDEIVLLLLVVEEELKERGALAWIDPLTGTIALSPRTKDLLTIVANALRPTVVFASEVQEAQMLEKQFGCKLVNCD